MRNPIDLASVSKRLTFMVVLIVIMCFLSSCPSLFADGDDDTGDNDDFDNATEISYSTNTWTGEISSTTDIDVFKKRFDTGWYYIDLTDLTKDLDIEIWNSSESYVNSSDESGNTDERIHQSIVQGGDYYIVVYGVSGAKSGYTITITKLP